MVDFVLEQISASHIVGLMQRNPTFLIQYRRAIVPGGTVFFILVTDMSNMRFYEHD